VMVVLNGVAHVGISMAMTQKLEIGMKYNPSALDARNERSGCR
jgi:hypothetical protein